MMSILFCLVFMIPLCFLGEFWLFQFLFFFISFIFLFMFSSGGDFIFLSNCLGMDLVSWSLVMLSFWVCSLMILASESILNYKNYAGLFMLVILFLMFSLYISFLSLNLFLFYLFFEISLIPTLILILGWGYQPERIEAGIYLLFYTLFVSLPMMVFIFFYYESYFTLSFFLMEGNLDSILFYLITNGVFFVKIPMFFLHLWLPKAHVEAPVSGSMILAGIMLKLGGYGLLRLMKLYMMIGFSVNYIFIVISLIGGFIVSLVCIRQSDMKSLIAYSSVAHMGLVLGGIMTLSSWGFIGSLLMMLAHGLCSSGLFCLSNISYERLGSRSLYLSKGLINIIPSLSLWWFLFCSSNMAAPPSLNLSGEILLINSLVSFSTLSMIFLILMSFFSAVYSLFLYSFSQHGNYYLGSYSVYSGVVREYLLLMLHWLPLNVLVLKGDLFVSWA